MVVLRDPATGAVTRKWKAHDKPAVMAAAERLTQALRRSGD